MVITKYWLNSLHCTIYPCVYECVLSRVHLFAAPRTVACQASLSVGFPRQECWNGLYFLLRSCAF